MPTHSTKSYRVGGTAPLILNLGIIWRQVVRLKHSAALHPGQQPLVPLNRRLGGPGAGLEDLEKKKIVLPLLGFKLCPKTVLQIHILNSCNFLKVSSTQFTVKTPHLQLCIIVLSRCQHVWHFTVIQQWRMGWCCTVSLLIFCDPNLVSGQCLQVPVLIKIFPDFWNADQYLPPLDMKCHNLRFRSHLFPHHTRQSQSCLFLDLRSSFPVHQNSCIESTTNTSGTTNQHDLLSST